MKIFKKLAPFALAIAIVIGIMPISPITASADSDYPIITENEEMVLSSDIGGQSVFYKFVPKESGEYSFFSYNTALDPKCAIYDADMNHLTDSDDEGEGYNFDARLVMTAGETYYLETGIFDTDITDTYTFMIAKIVAATSMSINAGDTLSGYVGAAIELTPVFNPIYSFDESVEWESSNKSVADFNEDGFLKLLSTGTAVITATSENGLTATCTVTVKDYTAIELNTETIVSLSPSKPSEYFSFTPLKDGYYSFYSIAFEDTCANLYNSELELITSDDDSGDAQNFILNSFLEADNTYILEARFFEQETVGDFSVYLKETVGVTKLEIVSLPIKTEYVSDTVGENLSHNGLKLKAYLSDGTEVLWSYDTDDNMIAENPIQYDISNIRENGIVLIRCGGAEVSYQVTFIDDPVKELVLVSTTSHTYIENTEGYWEDDIFIYDTYYPDDAIVKIIFTDGTSVTTNVGATVDGEAISCSDNQYTSPWSVGGDNYLVASYLGHTVNMPVKLIANPVESIEVLSGEITCIENADCSEDMWYEDSSEEGIPYLRYHYNIPSDITVKINYTDGTSQTAGILDTVKGRGFDWTDDQYKNEWTIGGNNYITVSYLGATDTVPVALIPAAEKIVLNSVPTREYVYGDTETGSFDDNGNYYYYPDDLEGLSFTVYYKNGTNKTFSYADIDEFDYIDGHYYRLNFDDMNPIIGKNPVSFEYMGAEAEYEVTVKASTVASIEMTKAPTVTEYSEFFTPTFEGMELTITYTDSRTLKVTLSEEDIDYRYTPWYETYYYVSVDGYQLTISPYSSEDGTYYVADYLGKSCVIDAITRVENKDISSIELDNISPSGDGMLVKITYTDSTYEILKPQLIYSIEYDSSFAVHIAKTEKGILSYAVRTVTKEDGRLINYHFTIFEQQVYTNISAVFTGDIDGNGILSATDLVMVRKALLGVSRTALNEDSVYDLTEDGEIDIRDLVRLKKLVAYYTVSYGDANGDGTVTSEDLTLLRAAVLDPESIDDELRVLYDVNADGEIDLLDVIKLKGYLNGEDVTLGTA